jgi:hypothetical protein
MLQITNPVYEHHRLTPQKTKAGRHAKLHTPEKVILKNWLESSPSHYRLPWKHVQHFLPGFGTKAVTTAFHDLKYCRRTYKKKGFLEDPEVIRSRQVFAKDGIT